MSKLVRARKKKVVSRSFHKAGIVVPIIDDIGYRCLHYDNCEFFLMLSSRKEKENQFEITFKCNFFLFVVMRAIYVNKFGSLVCLQFFDLCTFVISKFMKVQLTKNDKSQKA